jgi:hypothetical protein
MFSIATDKSREMLQRYVAAIYARVGIAYQPLAADSALLEANVCLFHRYTFHALPVALFDGNGQGMVTEHMRDTLQWAYQWQSGKGGHAHNLCLLALHFGNARQRWLAYYNLKRIYQGFDCPRLAAMCHRRIHLPLYGKLFT